MRLVFFLFTTLASIYANASTGDMSFGVEVGKPGVALTGNYWTQPNQSLDFGVGFRSHSQEIYADYLWHFLPGQQQFNPYLGIGGGLRFWSHDVTTDDCDRWHDCDSDTDHQSGTTAFAKGLVGVEWKVPQTKLGFFAEVGPEVNVTGTNSGHVGTDYGVGIRYYF